MVRILYQQGHHDKNQLPRFQVVGFFFLKYYPFLGSSDIWDQVIFKDNRNFFW